MAKKAASPRIEKVTLEDLANQILPDNLRTAIDDVDINVNIPETKPTAVVVAEKSHLNFALKGRVSYKKIIAIALFALSGLSAFITTLVGVILKNWPN